MTQSRIMRFLLPAVALLTIVIYVFGFDGTFIYDDYNQIVENPEIQNIFKLHDVIFNGNRQIRVWQNLLFGFSWTLSGGKIWSFKLLNLILHLLNTLLLFRWLKKFFADQPFLPVVASALFLIHPLQTQSVTYVMGEVSLIQSLFYLMAILWYTNHRLKRMTGLSVILILSLLAKETCALIPLVLFAYEFLVLKKNHEKIEWKKWALLFSIPFLYLPIHSILKDPVSMYNGVTGFELFNFFPYIAAQLYYQTFYFLLMVKPEWQSLIHGTPILNAWSMLEAVFGGVTWLGGAWFIFFRGKKYPRIAFLVFLYFVCYLPTNSFFQMINPFAEYRLYQTNAILLIGFSWMLIRFAEFLGSKTSFRMPLLTLIIPVVFFFSFHTSLIVNLWKYEISVYSQVEDLYPNRYKILAAISVAYAQKYDMVNAFKYMAKSRKIAKFLFPIMTENFIAYSKILANQGRLSEAWSIIDMLEKDPTVKKLEPSFYEYKDQITKLAIEKGQVLEKLPEHSVKIYDEVIPY